LKQIALAGLAASWLEDGAKQAWISEWSAEIDRLMEAELTSQALYDTRRKRIQHDQAIASNPPRLSPHRRRRGRFARSS
jgi:hypothetical protein